MSTEDFKHLELLGIFHYILGGITAFLSCMPLLHIFMGLAILTGRICETSDDSGPPPIVGWMFVIMGTVFIVLVPYRTTTPIKNKLSRRHVA